MILKLEGDLVKRREELEEEKDEVLGWLGAQVSFLNKLKDR